MSTTTVPTGKRKLRDMRDAWEYMLSCLMRLEDARPVDMTAVIIDLMVARMRMSAAIDALIDERGCRE